MYDKYRKQKSLSLYCYCGLTFKLIYLESTYGIPALIIFKGQSRQLVAQN